MLDSGHLAIKPRPEPKPVPLLKDAIRVYMAGHGGMVTAVEVAGVVGCDVAVAFDTIKDLMREGHVRFAALDAYEPGTKFPFKTPRDRYEKTLFSFDAT